MLLTNMFVSSILHASLHICCYYYCHCVVADSRNFGGEFYGPGSRCFSQGGPWMLNVVGSGAVTAVDYGSGCYKVNTVH